jgi:predicted dehydrogenase
MATPLRIGLIGCGFRGRGHSSAIRNIKRLGLLDLDYVAVADTIEERARSFAEITGAAVAGAHEIIDSREITVVYINTPTASHKDLVLRAAARGKHIFCEKPLATSLADVEEMVAAVRRAGVKTGVGLVLRHSPVLTVLKELTEDATLGRLMAVIFRDDQFFPIQGFYESDWRKDRLVVGGGTLLEHSIHDADILRWFGGAIAAVRGSLGNFAGFEGVEDLAMAHIEYESGAVAELVSIWHSVLGRPSARRMELFFEKGLFYVDHDFIGPIHFQTHARNAEAVAEEEVARRYLEVLGLDGPAFHDALKHSLEDYFFLKAVAGGKDPFPGFDVALEAHRVVDAVYRSAHAGGERLTLS